MKKLNSTGCASLAERVKQEPRFLRTRASEQQDAAPSVALSEDLADRAQTAEEMAAIDVAKIFAEPMQPEPEPELEEKL